MDIVEHNGPLALVTFIDEINLEKNPFWGMARVKKNYLRPITGEAFLLATRSVLQEADLAHIFYIDNKRIYIVWCSEKKTIYKQLRTLIGTTLIRPGLSVNPSVIVAYIDVFKKTEDLKIALKATGDMTDRLFDDAENSAVPADMERDDEDSPEATDARSTLTTTHAEVEHFQRVRGEKPYRKQLQFLVAEDQVFSQKLLCDVLRSVRAYNNNETPLINVVDGIHDAWKIFLKKAPDITFVDLGLVDGSGHTLARAMKELDPSSYVIIVTANNFEEELSVAKQNNVDGFISKPYNKKQIFDFIERYINGLKSNAKGGGRGFTSQLR